MKCNSCGAINNAGKMKCDFCGSEIASAQDRSGVDVLTTMAKPQISYVQDTLNLITELNSTPSSGFKFWAFLFPVPYLWGYGSNDNAKKVALTSLLPALIVSIIGYFSYDLAGMLDAIAFLWSLFVSYLVSTRTHALLNKGSTYNLGAGIVALIVFVVLYALIMAL